MYNRLPAPMSDVVWAIQASALCAGLPVLRVTPRLINIEVRASAFFVLLALLLPTACGRKAETPADPHLVRCAVIGGMTMTGLWPELTRMFEAQTGYRTELVVTGPRPELDKAMRAGQVDLLTMHSGDITTDLVADGFGMNMRPWTRNELCILGPPDDPAHVRGMRNGASALRKIAEAKARFVDFQGIGSRELAHNLWRLAGAEPKGDWVIRDDTVSKWNILQFARSNHAYVVVGYIPTRFQKMNADGMEILVKDDPLMRRPFIVMEANPGRVPYANTVGARALSDFLVSDTVQHFLLAFGTRTNGPGPLFFPVNTSNH
jgi:tungstate transport system substrate-binding protein